MKFLISNLLYKMFWGTLILYFLSVIFLSDFISDVLFVIPVLIILIDSICLFLKYKNEKHIFYLEWFACVCIIVATFVSFIVEVNKIETIVSFVFIAVIVYTRSRLDKARKI